MELQYEKTSGPYSVGFKRFWTKADQHCLVYYPILKEVVADEDQVQYDMWDHRGDNSDLLNLAWLCLSYKAFYYNISKLLPTRNELFNRTKLGVKPDAKFNLKNVDKLVPIVI